AVVAAEAEAREAAARVVLDDAAAEVDDADAVVVVVADVELVARRIDGDRKDARNRSGRRCATVAVVAKVTGARHRRDDPRGIDFADALVVLIGEEDAAVASDRIATWIRKLGAGGWATVAGKAWEAIACQQVDGLCAGIARRKADNCG